MNMVVGFRPQVYCVSACLFLTMLRQRKKNKVFTKMEPERRRYKYGSSHSEVLLKVAVLEKLTKLLKNSGERAPFLVKLEAKGDKIIVHLHHLWLYDGKKGEPSATKR